MLSAIRSALGIERSPSPEPIELRERRANPTTGFVRAFTYSPPPEFIGTSIVYSDTDGFYAGEWAGGKRNGHGTYIWPNGKSYAGNFVDNRLEGRGRMLYYDGSIYEGDFHNGRRHGQGRMYNKSTRSWYEGQWKEDRRHGKGICDRIDGTTLDGQWNMGRYIGPAPSSD